MVGVGVSERDASTSLGQVGKNQKKTGQSGEFFLLFFPRYIFSAAAKKFLTFSKHTKRDKTFHKAQKSKQLNHGSLRRPLLQHQGARARQNQARVHASRRRAPAGSRFPRAQPDDARGASFSPPQKKKKKKTPRGGGGRKSNRKKTDIPEWHAPLPRSRSPFPPSHDDGDAQRTSVRGCTCVLVTYFRQRPRLRSIHAHATNTSFSYVIFFLRHPHLSC